MATKPKSYKGSTQISAGVFYAPYIPLDFRTRYSMRYYVVSTYQDVNALWYIIASQTPGISEWIVNLPEGSWRYANGRGGQFEIREDSYTLFVLKWG